MNRIKSLLGIFAFSLLLLGAMPATASAQYGEVLGGIFGGRNDRNGNYNQRAVSDAIRRVDSRADDFRKALDNALDNSRYDGRRQEDRILSVAKDFERAASRLNDRFDNNRNSRRGDSEARTLLQLGRQLDNFVYNNSYRNDRRRSNDMRRLENEWSQIRRDLQTISSYYGFNSGYNNDRNRRDRDDDDYRRDRRDRRDDFPF